MQLSAFCMLYKIMGWHFLKNIPGVKCVSVFAPEKLLVYCIGKSEQIFLSNC